MTVSKNKKVRKKAAAAIIGLVCLAGLVAGLSIASRQTDIPTSQADGFMRTGAEAGGAAEQAVGLGPSEIKEATTGSRAATWQEGYTRLLRGISDDGWNTDYYRAYFSLWDMDGDGMPELLVFYKDMVGWLDAQHAVLSVYTYDGGTVRHAGTYENASLALTGLRRSESPAYPSLFSRWWGLGEDNYGYLTIRNGVLVHEDVRHIRRDCPVPIHSDISGDEQLVKESYAVFDKHDNFLEEHLLGGLDDAAIMGILRGDTPAVGEAPYDIVMMVYEEGDIYIRYPQICGLGDDRREEAVNALILDDLLFAEVESVELNYFGPEDATLALMLNLDSEIMLSTAGVLSIRHFGTGQLYFWEDELFGFGPDRRGGVTRAITIDLQTAAKVSLEELFSESMHKQYDGNFKYRFEGPDRMSHFTTITENGIPEIFIDHIKNFTDYHHQHYHEYYLTQDELGLILDGIFYQQYEFLVKYRDIWRSIDFDNPLWDGILGAGSGLG